MGYRRVVEVKQAEIVFVPGPRVLAILALVPALRLRAHFF